MLKNYKYVFFDLDDTLCNYKLAKEIAREKINTLLKINNIRIDDFWIQCNQKEQELMKDFLNGIISKDEYRVRRYKDALVYFKCNKIEYLTHKFNEIYMEEGNINIKLFDDVIPFFSYLKKKEIPIAIITNGPSDGQRTKINSLNINKYTNKIYISEEIGYSKPDKRIFLFVLKELKLKNNEVIMIGDNYKQDYEGARLLNIDSIFLERNNKCNKTNIKKKSGFNNLKELNIF